MQHLNKEKLHKSAGHDRAVEQVVRSESKVPADSMVDLDMIPRFIRLLMVDGKKNVAYKNFSAASAQFLRSIDPIARGRIASAHGLALQLQIAVSNVSPPLECKKCRVAGASRQVPAIVPQRRGHTLAMRWLIEFARKRQKKSKSSFSQCLAQELVDAYQKQGGARQRRDQLLQLSSGNRGYLRYRWW